MKLVFATGNKGKLREAREILGPQFEILSPDDLGIDPEVEETGSTFQENSLIKAEHLFKAVSQLDCAIDGVFSDDSGLEVDALGGAPGIYSARYASDHNFSDNIDKLLHELNRLEPITPSCPTCSGISSPNQLAPSAFSTAARFKCVVTLILSNDATPHYFDGTLEGRIARQRSGSGGFGYDPVFISGKYPDKTLSELPEEVKNSISHRGEALRKLSAWLAEQL